MELYTNDFGSRGWAETYASSEDVLLWQNQVHLQHLRLRGSAMLGGFLLNGIVGATELAQLVTRLPQLQAIELEHCPDLTAQQLMQLVGSGAVRVVMVQRCAAVSDADCLAAEVAGNGRCTVLYSS